MNKVTAGLIVLVYIGCSLPFGDGSITQAHKACKSYFFGDRSIRRTVYSNGLVKLFWVAMYSKKETGNL